MSGKLTIYVYFVDNHVDYNVDYYIDYYVDHGFDGLHLVEGDCVVSWLLVCGWLVTADTSRSTSDPGFCRFPGYFYMYTRNFFVNIDQTINIIYIIYSVFVYFWAKVLNNV